MELPHSRRNTAVGKGLVSSRVPSTIDPDCNVLVIGSACSAPRRRARSRDAKKCVVGVLPWWCLFGAAGLPRLRRARSAPAA
eukprot:5634133-Pyramimonas_sp.AAC.1